MRKAIVRGYGFTLVELLVVIGIIALLISILIPSLANAHEAAKRTKCLSNMKQIGLASLQYCNDNKGFMMWRFRTVGGITGCTRTYGPDAGGTAAGVALLIPPPVGGARQKYMASNEAFFCPSDYLRAPYRQKFVSGGVTYLRWGPTNPGSATFGSMSYFAYYIPEQSFGTTGVWSYQPPDLINDRYHIKRAQERAWLTDQGFVPASLATAEQAAQFTYGFFHGNNDGSRGWNVLYLDGHAKWVRRSNMLPSLKLYNPSATYADFQQGSIVGFNANY